MRYPVAPAYEKMIASLLYQEVLTPEQKREELRKRYTPSCPITLKQLCESANGTRVYPGDDNTPTGDFYLFKLFCEALGLEEDAIVLHYASGKFKDRKGFWKTYNEPTIRCTEEGQYKLTFGQQSFDLIHRPTDKAVFFDVEGDTDVSLRLYAAKDDKKETVAVQLLWKTQVYDPELAEETSILVTIKVKINYPEGVSAEQLRSINKEVFASMENNVRHQAVQKPANPGASSKYIPIRELEPGLYQLDGVNTELDKYNKVNAPIRKLAVWNDLANRDQFLKDYEQGVQSEFSAVVRMGGYMSADYLPKLKSGQIGCRFLILPLTGTSHGDDGTVYRTPLVSDFIWELDYTPEMLHEFLLKELIDEAYEHNNRSREKYRRTNYLDDYVLDPFKPDAQQLAAGTEAKAIKSAEVDEDLDEEEAPTQPPTKALKSAAPTEAAELFDEDAADSVVDVPATPATPAKAKRKAPPVNTAVPAATAPATPKKKKKKLAF